MCAARDADDQRHMPRNQLTMVCTRYIVQHSSSAAESTYFNEKPVLVLYLVTRGKGFDAIDGGANVETPGSKIRAHLTNR